MRPRNRRPAAFLFFPPHCLKKNAVPDRRHIASISSTHSGFISRGFYYELGDPGTSRTLLSSGVSGEDGSYARGAAVNGSDDTLVSGQWWIDPPWGAECYGEYNALGWTVASSTSTTTLREDFGSSGTPDLMLWEARARAVNAGSERGGEYQDTETDCVRRAVHWTASGVASDLGLISPLTSFDETTVNAMTDADTNDGIMVVGVNSSSDYGMIWWRGSSSGSFTATRATDLCARPSGWSFLTFEDVNSAGWIVGTGYSPDFANQRAFLLIPDVCLSDLDGDRDIDAADLAILLGAWRTCPGCCPADIDGSGTVDATDLAILLGDWGECSLCSENSNLMATSSEGETDLGSALEDALAVFGYADVPAFSAWLDELEPEARKNVLDTLYALLAS